MFKVTVPEIKDVFFKMKCGTALVSSGNGVGHGDSRRTLEFFPPVES